MTSFHLSSVLVGELEAPVSVALNLFMIEGGVSAGECVLDIGQAAREAGSSTDHL
jgi:hypothetical protein